MREETIFAEAGVRSHEFPPRPERVAANLRRVTEIVGNRIDTLRDTIDQAHDAFDALRARVDALEQAVSVLLSWRADTVAPALQALNQKNQQQDSRIAALEARISGNTTVAGARATAAAHARAGS